MAGRGGGAQRGVLGHGSPGSEQGGRLVAALEGKADEPQWLDELLEHKSLADGLPGSVFSWAVVDRRWWAMVHSTLGVTFSEETPISLKNPQKETLEKIKPKKH